MHLCVGIIVIFNVNVTASIYIFIGITVVAAHYARTMSTFFSPIQESLQGAVVFITGGTGYVGSGIIEKLLRSTPNIKKIYLLIRPKKNKTVETRLDELFEGPVSYFLILLYTWIHISPPFGLMEKIYSRLSVSRIHLFTQPRRFAIHK